MDMDMAWAGEWGGYVDRGDRMDCDYCVAS